MNHKIRGVVLILLLIFSSLPAYSSFLDKPILDKSLLDEPITDYSEPIIEETNEDNTITGNSVNEITAYDVFDNIKKFFNKINPFKKKTVGTVIEHDMDYDQLKLQCPDPKCLVNTDQGYQCMDSGDGFFNFRDEQSNVCLNGQLESYNEQMCITDVYCKHKPGSPFGTETEKSQENTCF